MKCYLISFPDYALISWSILWIFWVKWLCLLPIPHLYERYFATCLILYFIIHASIRNHILLMSQLFLKLLYCRIIKGLWDEEVKQCVNSLLFDLAINDNRPYFSRKYRIACHLVTNDSAFCLFWCNFVRFWYDVFTITDIKCYMYSL